MLDQHPGLGVLEDQGALDRCQAVVDRGKDGAERAGREERLEERAVVRAEPGDPITTDDPEATEPTRQSADALGQLGVGDRTIPGDDRRTIGIDPRSPLDPRADADACRCLDAHRDRMPDDWKGSMARPATHSGRRSRASEALRARHVLSTRRPRRERLRGGPRGDFDDRAHWSRGSRTASAGVGRSRALVARMAMRAGGAERGTGWARADQCGDVLLADNQSWECQGRVVGRRAALPTGSLR